MKPDHTIPKNIIWASDILEHAQTLKQQPREFFFEPLKKIITKNLNPETKGMMGCFSTQIINKITTEISKSIAEHLLSELNPIIHSEAKSIKELLQALNYSFGNQKKSPYKRFVKTRGQVIYKSTGVQTQPQIICITPVVSLGVQTSKTASKSVVISNNFKVKTEPVHESLFIDRQCSMKSIMNKEPRLVRENKKNSELYSKSYQIKKWSIDNMYLYNDSLKQKRVVAPSYYPSNKPSRAKFYYQKFNSKRNSFFKKHSLSVTH